MKFKTRYVHQIAPRDTDVGPDVEIGHDDLTSMTKLAAKLRRARVLDSGARIREMRVDNQGRIVVFPSMPGMTTYWHSVILTPA